MAETPSRLLVGRILRAHGLRGDVVVRLTTNRLERVDPGAVLFDEGGAELVVETSRPHDANHLVRFVDVSERSSAETLKGTDLFAEPIDDESELWVHDLIGSTVVDQRGVDRGKVSDVIANPASDLLQLESGALVPVAFVASHDDRTIRVETPDGLFDL